MAIDKTQRRSNTDIAGVLNLAGKTITAVNTYRHGSTEVVEIFCTDASHNMIKFQQGMCEVGGQAEWDTGTKIGAR